MVDKLPQIIGLCGRRGCGKDATATILKRWGYQRLAFADPLKAMLLAVDPIVRHDGEGTEVRVSYLVKEYGWDYAKTQSEVRRLLMKLGTEGVRECLWDRVWIDALGVALKRHLNAGIKVAITDMRYVNESHFLISASPSTVLWRIVRPGFDDPATSHRSENELEQISPVRRIVADNLETLEKEIELALGVK